MHLTFDGGKFLLSIGEHDTTAFAPNVRAWIYNSAIEKYQTKNINAAARFKDHADAKAKYFLNRLLLRSVELPSGGVLSPKHLELMPFQKEKGVPFILSKNRSYLAHSPGLGKSAQAISAVASKPGRTLIICPSFLLTTWAREITKWFAHDFPDIGIMRTPHTNNGQDFLLVSDAIIARPDILGALVKTKFRYIFVDEGHRFKEPYSLRTTALFGGQSKKFKSRGLIYQGAEHVCLLSGTPMLNRPIELWPVLYAMAPETIDSMSYNSFGFRYGKPFQNEHGAWVFTGSNNEQELKARIMGKFMQRIDKADVLKDLPKKIHEVIYCDDTRDKAAIELDQNLIERLNETDLKKSESLGEYAILRKMTGLAKISFASNFVGNILHYDLDEQIILFAHHIDVVDGLAERLKMFRPRIIKGGVSPASRTETEDAFQKGECRLIIGNISAMNLGLTLTKATRVVFAEYDWTPSANEQAEDRANRIGSEHSIFCQYLVLPNSLDEYVLKRVLEKQQSIKGVMG